jgi:hypothetical protein
MAPGSAAALGALGGVAVQFTESFAALVKYRDRRMLARAARRPPPDWRDQFEIGVDLVILLLRALIGAGVAFLLRDQFSGTATAVVTGASGPSLLAQWGAASRVGKHGDPPDERDGSGSA